MKDKICIRCWEEPALKHKTYCKKCDSKRVLAARRAKTIPVSCSKCGSVVLEMKNELKLCRSCFQKDILGSQSDTVYEGSKGGSCERLHTRIAEILTGKEFKNSDEVVHHVDENKGNNHPDNLLIIDRDVHSKLHVFLNRFKVTYDGELPWDQMRLVMTKRFLDIYHFKSLWLKDSFLFANHETKDFINKLITTKVSRGQRGVFEDGKG